MTNFSDNDSKVRYSACEALFNVVKVTRGAVLPYFSEIFTVLSRLAADQDQGVKTASEHLDRLLKVPKLEIFSSPGKFTQLSLDKLLSIEQTLQILLFGGI